MDIVGNLCSSADLIAQDVAAPGLSEGDLVVIPNSGAYTQTTGMWGFNSQRLFAETMMDADGMLRPLEPQYALWLQANSPRQVRTDAERVDGSLSSLLIQQERKDPDRTYLYGHFGQISYGETLTRVTQLAQLLASSAASPGGSHSLSAQNRLNILPTAYGRRSSLTSAWYFLPLCRDPEVVLSAMRKTSVELLLTDEPVLLQESWCLDLKHYVAARLVGRWSAREQLQRLFRSPAMKAMLVLFSRPVEPLESQSGCSVNIGNSRPS